MWLTLCGDTRRRNVRGGRRRRSCRRSENALPGTRQRWTRSPSSHASASRHETRKSSVPSGLSKRGVCCAPRRVCFARPLECNGADANTNPSPAMTGVRKRSCWRLKRQRGWRGSGIKSKRGSNRCATLLARLLPPRGAPSPHPTRARAFGCDASSRRKRHRAWQRHRPRTRCRRSAIARCSSRS